MIEKSVLAQNMDIVNKKKKIEFYYPHRSINKIN